MGRPRRTKARSRPTKALCIDATFIPSFGRSRLTFDREEPLFRRFLWAVGPAFFGRDRALAPLVLGTWSERRSTDWVHRASRRAPNKERIPWSNRLQRK